MKKFVNFLRKIFERNGIIKIIIAFIVLGIGFGIEKKFPGTENICLYVKIISIGYILLSFLVYFIAGIVNSINDIIQKRNEETDTKEL